MTTPSIPDLIAALEEHDGAMSPAPWRHESIRTAEVHADHVAWTEIHDERSPVRYVAVEIGGTPADFTDPDDAAAIAWFGTHRGALAEALKAGLAAMDDMTPLTEPHNDGSVDKCPTYYDGCHCSVATLTHNIRRAERAEQERDEAKREAESLRALLGEARQYIKTRRGCDVDLLARIDLARGKDVTR